MTYPVEIEVQVESPQVVIQPSGAPVIIFAATTGVQGVQGPPGPVDVYEFANLAAFPSTGIPAKVYVADDTNKAYRWNGSTYIEVSPSVVTSVNGQTAVVVLAKSDVGLSNVDNTSDVNKPVSTAQAAADAATLASANSAATTADTTVLNTATGRAIGFAVAMAIALG
jgi:hypothetical protein